MRRVLCGVAMMLVAMGALAQARPGPTPETKTLRETVVEATATVEKVNVETRELTLKRPNGRLLPLVVGEEVRNLDKLKIGDTVKVRYKEAVTLTLDKRSGGQPSLTAEEGVTRSAKGSHPGGSAQREITIAAVIDAIDALNSTVTLKGPQGNLLDVILEDSAKLAKLNIGDIIEITYTEALAVSVESVDAK